MSDPFFGPAFIDVDEWRDAPVRHRYVHGGFENTDTRFSFYFPPAEQFEGRFIHTVEGGNGGHENTATGMLGAIGGGSGIEFALGNGAYLVESNQGHFGDDLSILKTEPTIHAYRASAHSARYGREVAAEMYGTPPRYGYVYGGSGGSARTILHIENCPDLYDGAIPFIMGHSTSWSLGFSVQANAARLLGSKIEGVIDAMEPGGSGDPFAGLNTLQREALTAMYRAGFPRGAEQSFATSGYVGTFASHVPALIEYDPTYFDDFWSVPGYAGADGVLDDVLVDEKTTVSRVVTAGDLASSDDGGSLFLRFAARGNPDLPLGIVVNDSEPRRMLGARIRIVSGAAAGRELYVTGVVGDVLLGGGDVTHRFEEVEPGDELAIDNRQYLGYAYFHRYQVEPDAPEYRQFLLDGRPMYPQRDRLFSQSGLLSGGNTTATLQGKMIVVQNAMDAACWPNAAVSYRRALSANVADLDQQFRVWFMDNAAHIPGSVIPSPKPPATTTRLIDYQGCLEQALRDLIDWVESGTEPPASSGYAVDDDQWVQLAPTAARRKGIQPTVAATANGAVRAEVRVGEPVTFKAVAEVPPGAGTIIQAEWDFDGSGTFPMRYEKIDGTKKRLTLNAKHTYDTPGTYFAAVRVITHRDGDVAARHRRVTNLGRVRVVVG